MDRKYCFIYHYFSFVACKRGHYAVLNSSDTADLLECTKCEVDTYQETESRKTNCTVCPEGANTNGANGSIKCCMLYLSIYCVINRAFSVFYIVKKNWQVVSNPLVLRMYEIFISKRTFLKVEF